MTRKRKLKEDCISLKGEILLTKNTIVKIVSCKVNRNRYSGIEVLVHPVSNKIKLVTIDASLLIPIE